MKRWGDGLEAPAAGSRNFVPHGFEVTLEVSEAIGRFGHSASHVASIMAAGRAKAQTAQTPFASAHSAAIYAYTEETPLYGTLMAGNRFIQDAFKTSPEFKSAVQKVLTTVGKRRDE